VVILYKYVSGAAGVQKERVQKNKVEIKSVHMLLLIILMLLETS